MTLVYVTGAPGAGKTTIQNELRLLGLEAYDVDDPEIGGAHNKLTGERVTIPLAENRSREWFEKHEWRTSKPAILNLKQRSQNSIIFLCGVASDDNDILSLFDKVIYLEVDENTLIKRISQRKNNDYGKSDLELAEILERRRAMDSKYKSPDVVHIDGSQEIKKIITMIVTEANNT